MATIGINWQTRSQDKTLPSMRNLDNQTPALHHQAGIRVAKKPTQALRGSDQTTIKAMASCSSPTGAHYYASDREKGSRNYDECMENSSFSQQDVLGNDHKKNVGVQLTIPLQ